MTGVRATVAYTIGCCRNLQRLYVWSSPRWGFSNCSREIRCKLESAEGCDEEWPLGCTIITIITSFIQPVGICPRYPLDGDRSHHLASVATFRHHRDTPLDGGLIVAYLSSVIVCFPLVERLLKIFGHGFAIRATYSWLFRNSYWQTVFNLNTTRILAWNTHVRVTFNRD